MSDLETYKNEAIKREEVGITLEITMPSLNVIIFRKNSLIKSFYAIKVIEKLKETINYETNCNKNKFIIYEFTLANYKY